jgi:hypothetical protein
MQELRGIGRLAIIGLALAGFFAGQMLAQERGGTSPAKETTMTGCLTKGTAGMYTLTDEKTGVKTTVTGPAELEKHAENHRVTLTGTAKADASGNQTFEVSKIQHQSTTCKVPGQDQQR